MSRQAVMNRRGRTLGFIETQPNGRQAAVTEKGAVLAIFDPYTNETIETSGRMMAEGNLLTDLLRGGR